MITQNSFYVEISHARAELVTDDAAQPGEQPESATGERISALEGIGEMARGAPAKGVEAADAKAGRMPEAKDRAMERSRESGPEKAPERDGGPTVGKDAEPAAPERAKSVERDLGL